MANYSFQRVVIEFHTLNEFPMIFSPFSIFFIYSSEHLKQLGSKVKKSYLIEKGFVCVFENFSW